MIPQKPGPTAAAELDEYRRIYRELNGVDAPPPRVASWVARHESEERAREVMQSYIRRYSLSAADHYELWNRVLADVKGYDYHGKVAARLAKDGVDKFVHFLTGLQVYGTPAQVYEKLERFQETTGANGFITVFSYGGMPEAEAHSSVELFAREVLPELHKLEAGPPVGEEREGEARRV